MSQTDQQKLRLCVEDMGDVQCKELKQWLKFHVPKCEYCQGFMCCIIERSEIK